MLYAVGVVGVDRAVVGVCMGESENGGSSSSLSSRGVLGSESL